MPDSWVVTRKADGRVMRETWNASVAAKVNRDAYTVETAAEYLGRINRAIRTAAASLLATPEPNPCPPSPPCPLPSAPRSPASSRMPA